MFPVSVPTADMCPVSIPKIGHVLRVHPHSGHVSVPKIGYSMFPVSTPTAVMCPVSVPKMSTPTIAMCPVFLANTMSISKYKSTSYLCNLFT